MSVETEPDRQTSLAKGENHELTDYTGLRFPAEKSADEISRYHLRNRSCSGR